jgi:hypothetical protein
VNFDEAVVAVRLARQQRLEAALFGRRLQRLDQRLALTDAGGVVLGFAELDQGRRVVELLLQRLDDADRALELRALAQQALGFLRIVPEGGVVGERVQLVETAEGLVPVKDASSAVRATA